jgi:hypothetical protein
MQEYVDSLPFAALRRYIGALQKALHTSIARLSLSPLKLARERVQCNITMLDRDPGSRACFLLRRQLIIRPPSRSQACILSG